MKFPVSLVVALAMGLGSAVAAEVPKAGSEKTAAPVPQRSEVELEPAGAAPGTTVRQARIAQNWLLLGLGSAALAAIIFGLSSSDSDSTSTTN